MDEWMEEENVRCIGGRNDNYGKKKNRTTFERAKKYEDVDQFA